MWKSQPGMFPSREKLFPYLNGPPQPPQKPLIEGTLRYYIRLHEEPFKERKIPQRKEIPLKTFSRLCSAWRLLSDVIVLDKGISAASVKPLSSLCFPSRSINISSRFFTLNSLALKWWQKARVEQKSLIGMARCRCAQRINDSSPRILVIHSQIHLCSAMRDVIHAKPPGKYEFGPKISFMPSSAI